MIDLARDKAVCEAFNTLRLRDREGEASEEFADEAAVGWPAALEEIEMLREALRTFKPCAYCISRVGRGGDCWGDDAECPSFKAWRRALGEEKA